MTSHAQPLPQSDHVVAPVRGTRIGPSPGSTASCPTNAAAPPDSQALQVRDWLLLLLRFAITLDAKDEKATSAKADQLDGLVSGGAPSAPTFFRRTTSEICRAITALDDPAQATTLEKHIARIDDPRLRRAFQAAVGVDDATSSARSGPKKHNLWAGLEKTAVAAHQFRRHRAAISKT
jgi:hypothetical protein